MPCVDYLDCNECQDCIGGECVNVTGTDNFGNDNCCIYDGDCENCFECVDNRCESYNGFDQYGNSCCDGVFIRNGRPYSCCFENDDVVIVRTDTSNKICCEETHCDSSVDECAPKNILNPSATCLAISAGGVYNRFTENISIDSSINAKGNYFFPSGGDSVIGNIDHLANTNNFTNVVSEDVGYPQNISSITSAVNLNEQFSISNFTTTIENISSFGMSELGSTTYIYGFSLNIPFISSAINLFGDITFISTDNTSVNMSNVFAGHEYHTVNNSGYSDNITNIVSSNALYGNSSVEEYISMKEYHFDIIFKNPISATHYGGYSNSNSLITDAKNLNNNDFSAEKQDLKYSDIAINFINVAPYSLENI